MRWDAWRSSRLGDGGLSTSAYIIDRVHCPSLRHGTTTKRSVGGKQGQCTLYHLMGFSQHSHEPAPVKYSKIHSSCLQSACGSPCRLHVKEETGSVQWVTAFICRGVSGESTGPPSTSPEGCLKDAQWPCACHLFVAYFSALLKCLFA